MHPLHTDMSVQTCPYCGEPIHLVIEPLEESQSYIEDCEVCCRPMLVTVGFEGEVSVRAENEA